MFKKMLAFLSVCTLILSVGFAVAESTPKLSIVTTIFPQYDFVRAIAGDTGAVNMTMLLKPGAEAHTFEPTPQDIIAIRNANLFIYVGGESDAWVTDILASMPDSQGKALRLIDMVPTVEEETVEGMQAEEDTAAPADASATEAPELDEHVWTSPVNAIAMVNTLCDDMSALDSADAATFRANADAYIAKLQALDTAFRDVVSTGKRKEFIFGDRFAQRYFAAEYGIKYYAAFPGCSSETEPSAQTVSFLINKVRADGIPVVLYPELSTHKVADAISEETGVPTHVFYACHNLTADEFAAGKTYVDFMTENLATLKVALN